MPLHSLPQAELPWANCKQNIITAVPREQKTRLWSPHYRPDREGSRVSYIAIGGCPRTYPRPFQTWKSLQSSVDAVQHDWLPVKLDFRSCVRCTTTADAVPQSRWDCNRRGWLRSAGAANPQLTLASWTRHGHRAADRQPVNQGRARRATFELSARAHGHSSDLSNRPSRSGQFSILHPRLYGRIFRHRRRSWNRPARGLWYGRPSPPAASMPG